MSPSGSGRRLVWLARRSGRRTGSLQGDPFFFSLLDSYRTWRLIASIFCLAESVHVFPDDLDFGPFSRLGRLPFRRLPAPRRGSRSIVRRDARGVGPDERFSIPAGTIRTSRIPLLPEPQKRRIDTNI
jgi:hypothetical protein